MDTINVNLNNLTDRERNELIDLVKRANNRNNEKFPAYGEKYYTIMDGGVFYARNEKREVDKARISVGNCFKNREDAEFEVERLKVLHKMREIAGDVNMNKKYLCNNPTYYTLEYGSNDKISSTAIKCYVNTGTVYVASEVVFADRMDAEKAIREIGTDTLKKYYFRIVD